MWKQGRQLAQMSKGATTWEYTYDDAGLRTQRTNGIKTYNYGYSGGQLRTMTVSSGSSTDYYTFRYGPDGHPYSVRVNDTDYFYLTNLQGDVTGIRDKNGTTVVSYIYDAWGNIVSTLGSKASTLGEANPLRYRGYVYDQETGLYYLQSRYYNPERGRFINADAYISTGTGLTGHNMFAYCNNNPVNYIDMDGENAEALQWWTAGMWWLCGVDTVLPIGDIIYVAGIVVLGIGAVIAATEIFESVSVDASSVYMAGHTKGARNSTRDKHQQGDKRRGMDGGKEKGDDRRINYRKNKRKASIAWGFLIVDTIDEDAWYYEPVWGFCKVRIDIVGGVQEQRIMQTH